MRARFEDWPSRLGDYLAAREAMPFGWLENDCCSHAAGAVIAMTGDDPMAGLRDYHDERTAIRMLARVGGVDGWLASRFPEIAIGMARRGDLGVIDRTDGLAAVVVDGALLCGVGPDGLIRTERARLLRAFAVG